jgi:transposase
MTELAVDRKGQILLRERVPTDIRSLRAVLETISGPKVMVLEESTLSAWLYRNLRHHVDRLVVCDPRRNRLICDDGDKTDPIDAAKLAELQRGGFTRQVYHTEDEDRQLLKEVVALYHDRIREQVRQTNKIRQRAYAHGVAIPSEPFQDGPARKQWLRELANPGLSKQLSLLWLGRDTGVEQAKKAKRLLARQARAFPMIRSWQALPGIGPIRAATLFAYLDTPWRFGGPKKLWKYCGLGLRRVASGTDKRGRPRPGYLKLHRNVNRRLKAAVVGAAHTAVGQGDNPFAQIHRRLCLSGCSGSNAYHTVARKLLTVMWGMWKTNRQYDERLV